MKIDMPKQQEKEEFLLKLQQIEKDLYIIAKTRVKDENETADIIQDTIIAAFENYHRLRQKEFFKTWMIRILINHCNSYYRKRRHVIFLEDYQKQEKAQGDMLKDNMSFQELIQDLDKEEKTILTLYYQLQYTTKEIGQILHKKDSTIRSKIKRAKEKLKRQYEGGNQDE